MESQQLIFARTVEGSNNWANLSAERLGKMEVKLMEGKTLTSLATLFPAYPMAILMEDRRKILRSAIREKEQIFHCC